MSTGGEGLMDKAGRKVEEVRGHPVLTIPSYL